jgi:hypothetical protein
MALPAAPMNKQDAIAAGHMICSPDTREYQKIDNTEHRKILIVQW